MTDRLVTVSSPKHGHMLTTGLWNLLLGTKQTDLTFKTENDRKIRAHQIIVEIFLSTEKFGGRPRDENEQTSPTKPDWMGDDHVGCLLEFMYTGTVDVNRDRLEGLVEVAEDLGFELLVEAAACALRNRDPATLKSKFRNKRTQTNNDDNENNPNETSETSIDAGSESEHDDAASCGVPNYDDEPPPRATRIPIKKKKKPPKGPFLPCRHCPFQTRVRNLLIQHEKQHAEQEVVEVPTYVCRRCGSVFYCPFNLRQHTATCKVEVQCPHCPFTSSSILACRKHVARHGPDGSGFPCRWCLKTLPDREAADEHEARHPLLTCDKCDDFVTRGFGRFNKHQRVAHGKEPGVMYSRVTKQCPGCQQHFPSAILMREHVKAEHRGERIFPCPKCPKRYTSETTVNQHLRSHTSDKPWVCEICGKRFFFPARLKMHRRTHTDDRPFECVICSKMFKCTDSLNQHRRLHLENVKNHVCHHCGRAFNRSTNLRAHIRTHNKERLFKCAECPSDFISRNGLDDHVARWHSACPSIPEFSCSKCGREFYKRRYYLKHMRNHVIEEGGSVPKHACTLCDRRFRKRGNLTIHTNKVHVVSLDDLEALQ